MCLDIVRKTYDFKHDEYLLGNHKFKQDELVVTKSCGACMHFVLS
jgi:hypothetical protein